MDKLTFKEIKNENLQEVLDIYNYYILNTTTTFHINALTLTEMRELVFFDNPVYKTFIIECKGVLCGYVILSQHKKREAYNGTAEVTIYLKLGYTGKGIGNNAVRFIENYAKTKEIHVLVSTICGDNSKSINLFKSNGYRQCAHYKEIGKKFDKFLDVFAFQKIIN